MPNVPGIVGLGAAALLAAENLDSSQEQMEALRNKLLALLQEGANETLTVLGEFAPRLPNTLAISFPGASGEAILARVPELCAAAGFEIDEDSERNTSTLAAIGAGRDIARGTVRLSIGAQTTDDDITRAASLLLGAWEALRT